jgi:hypothetical protein
MFHMMATFLLMCVFSEFYFKVLNLSILAFVMNELVLKHCDPLSFQNNWIQGVY